MKTLIISVGELTQAGQEPPRYPIQLCISDDEEPERVLASDFIPEDLSIPDPPVDADNEPLTKEKVREIIAGRKDQGDHFRAVGQYLYGVLSSGAIGPEWEKCRKENGSLRTVLEVTNDLRWLPWEFLFADGHWLFASPRKPFVRGQRPGKVEPQIIEWPIHALIVVGSEPHDQQVRAEDEIESIKQVRRELGVRGKLLELTILNQPSKTQLMQTLKDFKPHIFHYIGHGSIAGEEPVLPFSEGRDNPAAWEWDMTAIKTDLERLDPVPRFAFINACHTADFAQQLQAWTISDAFINAGVPAVLGMQSDVGGEAAAKFAGELYRALVEGEPLDGAMTKARAAVSDLPGITWKGRDWALASLHLSAAPEAVLPLKLEFDDEYCAQISSVVEFRRIRNFVDRTYQRRTLWHGIDPVQNPANYKGLLVLAGQENVGKTAIVHWCLEAYALRRRNFLYVDMEAQESFDFLKTMRVIIEGDQASVLSPPLRQDAFNKFHWELNHLLKNPHTEPPPLPEGLVADEGLKWHDGGDEKLMRRLFTSFREGLQKAAGGEPLIIVFDHLNINTADFTFLFQYLIKPIAERRLQPVRMILVLNQNGQELQFEELVSAFETIPVPPFKKCDYVRLVSDYCRYLATVDMEKALALIQAEADLRIKGDWMPKDLFTMRKTVLEYAMRDNI